MNKKLGLLLLTGLAAIFCASCSKVEELLPESFSHNGKPFSIEKVPVEGGSITLDRGRVTDSVYSIIRLNPSDTVSSFKAGDTIILTATPKNGYTFINWVRNGVGTSTNPIYKFCLEEKDLDNGRVKHHYEARFGNDYAIQSIPSIDEVMPADLIAEMGPYLNFGDNPPQINSFSFDVLQIKHFIHNSDHPEIPYDTTTMYYRRDGEFYPNKFYFEFESQHRGIFDSCKFERTYENIFGPSVDIDIIEYANTSDSIFIMGNGNDFTIYYRQSVKRRMEPSTEIPGAGNITGGLTITRVESTIITGTVSESDQSIQNFHWGFRIEGYNEENSAIGTTLPAIHDMFHYVEYHPNSNP